jgi:hypothetical protein
MTVECRTVASEDFGKSLSFLGASFMNASAAEKEHSGVEIVGLVQDIHWFGGNVRRMGITSYLGAKGTDYRFNEITSLCQDAFLHTALNLTALQCFSAFNRPLNIGASELIGDEDQHPARGFEGRAVFVPGAIILITHDDFYIEARTQACTKEGAEPQRCGLLLLPTPDKSSHSMMAVAENRRAATKILETMLKRNDRDVVLTTYDGPQI